jgi:hypothetical protein
MYNESTKQNYKKLAKIYIEYQKWIRKYRLQFYLDKYKLIHFSYIKKKFNISIKVRLKRQSVGPKIDIYILGV